MRVAKRGENCPFYGYAISRRLDGRGVPFILFPTEGNQCALVTDRAAPCSMETAGLVVDHFACRRVSEIQCVPDDVADDVFEQNARKITDRARENEIINELIMKHLPPHPDEAKS